jgi:hypothetical protein
VDTDQSPNLTGNLCIQFVITLYTMDLYLSMSYTVQSHREKEKIICSILQHEHSTHLDSVMNVNYGIPAGKMSELTAGFSRLLMMSWVGI